jgi:hypothetical protein
MDQPSTYKILHQKEKTDIEVGRDASTLAVISQVNLSI